MIPWRGEPMGRRRFAAILIKPSHYDANGYVIQWRRSSIAQHNDLLVIGQIPTSGCSMQDTT